MSHACYVCNYEPVPDGDGVECPHCHRLQYGNMCPHCGQNAPTIIRGTKVHCSACNAVRGPLAGGLPLNVVGSGGRVGGAIAGFLGWGTIAATVFAAVVVGLLLSWIGLPTAGLVAGGAIGALGLVIGMALLFGSRSLRRRGSDALAQAREQAVF